jgi:N-acylglucosamine-6-phosphate 2-epimerase
MALAAGQGGARGIRAQGVEDVRAIAAAVDRPIIGLKKAPPLVPDRVYITPTLEHAAELIAAGADVVALDATPMSSV